MASTIAAIRATFLSYNSLPIKYTNTAVSIPNIAGASLAIMSDTPKLAKNIDTMNCKKSGCALYIEKYFANSSLPANVADWPLYTASSPLNPMWPKSQSRGSEAVTMIIIRNNHSCLDKLNRSLSTFWNDNAVGK